MKIEKRDLYQGTPSGLPGRVTPRAALAAGAGVPAAEVGQPLPHGGGIAKAKP